MLPLQYSRYWRIASIVILILVLAATMLPAAWFFGDKASALSWFVHADKWLHGATFLVLALWFAGQYRARSYWRVAVGLMVFGFLIELCQLMVSYRTADWIDIGANTAGIIAGLAVASAGLGGWCLRVEAWHMARSDGSQLD